MLAAVQVRLQRDRLTDAHRGELRLLEVRIDPYLVERNDRHQRRTGRHALAELHRALRDVAGHGRRQLRARDVEIRVVHLRRRREHVGMVRDRRAIDARLIGRELLLRRDQRRLGARERVARMLQLFAGDRTGAREALAARRGPRVARATSALRMLDRRPELRGRREQSAHLAHRLGELRVGLLERDSRIGRIELHQRLPRVDELRVVGGDADHGARDLRRDLHDVAAHVRIVGGLRVAQRDRPVAAVAEGDQRERAEDDREPALARVAQRAVIRGLLLVGGLRCVAHDVPAFVVLVRSLRFGAHRATLASAGVGVG